MTTKSKETSLVDFPEEVAETNGIKVKVYGETSYENLQPERHKSDNQNQRTTVNKEEVLEPEMTEEEKKRELLSLAGCWTNDPEDAARMESAIKDGRKNEFMREINLDD